MVRELVIVDRVRNCAPPVTERVVETTPRVRFAQLVVGEQCAVERVGVCDRVGDENHRCPHLTHF
jgi:hypothetical protein